MHRQFRRVALLGADGMLGRAWRRSLLQEGIPHVAFSREQLDLLDDSYLEQLTPEFDLVVNAAAYTAVDRAEDDAATAFRVNGDAVGRLAAVCKRSGALLLHYSTDYVFDGRGASGEGRLPYPVDAKPAPANVYGASKLLGEQRIRFEGAEALVIRTSWVYAPWGRNFVRRIVLELSNRASLRVVDDQRGRPSSALELAKNGLALARLGALGTYHLTDGGECSWYELAKRIALELGSRTEIVPCSSAEHPLRAARPAFSVLDISRGEALLGKLKPWQVALAEVLDAIKASQS